MVVNPSHHGFVLQPLKWSLNEATPMFFTTTSCPSRPMRPISPPHLQHPGAQDKRRRGLRCKTLTGRQHEPTSVNGKPLQWFRDQQGWAQRLPIRVANDPCHPHSSVAHATYGSHFEWSQLSANCSRSLCPPSTSQPPQAQHIWCEADPSVP